MVEILKNNFLIISVKNHGAELCSLKSVKNNKEYLWQADEKYWGKHAPILFPVIGCMKNNKYLYNGKSYEMTKHGFARDFDFELVEKSGDKLVYLLKDNEKTDKMYPFKFELYVTYKLIDEKLEIMYEVKNKDNKKMYFSIGAHPAFNCNILEGDKYLGFDKKETLDTYAINLGNGLIENKKKEILKNQKEILLTYGLFKEDALVFDNIKSDFVYIRDGITNEKLKFTFKGFPYLGIWTPPAPFLCIEPWYGIADSVDTKGNLEDKIGIEKLDANETFNCNYEIEIIN